MTRPSHPFLWFLLATALFMRALQPQGYMPERSTSGSIAVVVCGSGAVNRIPIGDGHDRGDEQQRAEPPCAFAGLAAPAVPAPALPELLLPARAVLARAEQARASRLSPRRTSICPSEDRR